jgi:hypothetical protein
MTAIAIVMTEASWICRVGQGTPSSQVHFLLFRESTTGRCDGRRHTTMGAAWKMEESDDHRWVVQEPRRRTARRTVHLCIDVCSQHDFWTGLTMNLSEGGVFVATHVLLEPKTLVGLHLELPRFRRILALGEVRWTRMYTGDDDVPPGLGIEFVGLDLASLTMIREFLATVETPLPTL